ncbi:MAG: rod shape-determining protein MreD [Chitinophagaceae bacterium]|nr:rod shape-determining protein MreD [Chitinophagaceae bacterium]
MNALVKNMIRFMLFILVQVFVLDNIHLHQMLTPYIYFLFILWLPFRIGRTQLMMIAFALGFTLDSFRHHPGFHTAACLLIAYIRPFLIGLLIPQEGADNNYEEPSIKSMGGVLPYLIFVGVLTLLHHGWLFFLEAWQFGNIWYFLVKTLLSTVLSLVLIMITELLFTRQQKFRTNTV